VASGSVQTEGTVGEELADERVGGKADGDAVRVLGCCSRYGRVGYRLTQERHLAIG
jgi:predicted N-acetyltransferase YhbS